MNAITRPASNPPLIPSKKSIAVNVVTQEWPQGSKKVV